MTESQKILVVFVQTYGRMLMDRNVEESQKAEQLAATYYSLCHRYTAKELLDACNRAIQDYRGTKRYPFASEIEFYMQVTRRESGEPDGSCSVFRHRWVCTNEGCGQEISDCLCKRATVKKVVVA